MLEISGFESDDLFKQLMQQMFAEQSDVRRIEVAELPGAHIGLSSIALFLVYPYGAQNDAYNPLVVRTGSRAALEHERRNYDAYIKGRTGLYLAQQRRYASIGETAAIAYDYIRSSTGRESIQTLREYLDRDNDLDAACQAIRALFLHTLSQGTQPNGWYNDARRIDPAQRSLWFYNTMLPPTIVLEQATIVETPSAALAIEDCLAQSDQPAGQDLIGQTVVLGNRVFPYRQIESCEISGEICRVRLLLFEREPTERTTYCAVEPIAARVDLSGPPELARIQENPAGLIVQGRVYETRYTALASFVRRLGDLPFRQSDGRIVHQDRTLINPLECYYDLLLKPRSLTTSIIHGDMNLGNILFSYPERSHSRSQIEGPLTTWLIDFDKTTSGAPTVFDAVKLETEYKIHVLPHTLHGFDDFMRLERALHQALIAPDPALRSINDTPRLLKAYQFIATIRRSFLQELTQSSIEPIEYYLGLLAYGLAALKYQNLYGDAASRQRWLRRSACFEHLATAAYLSASFAATILQDWDTISVRPECYPVAPKRQYNQLPRHPWLVGRDTLLATAKQRMFAEQDMRMRPEQPVVVLYGSAGSGRGSVAEALCNEFRQDGAAICDWVPAPSDLITIESFVQNTLMTLHHLGIHKRALPQKQPPSRIGLPTLEADCQEMRRQLVAALEFRKASKPVVLLIRLDPATLELRRFVAQLARELMRTPMVVISDRPLADLDFGLTLEVAPLSFDDVRALVRYERLPLEEAAIAHLYTHSRGIPRLLKRVVIAAQLFQQQHHCSLTEAMMNQAIPPIEDMLQFLADPIRHLLELDALRDPYVPRTHATLESLYRAVGPAMGWVIPANLAEDTATYLRQYDDGDLWPILLEPALKTLRTRGEFRRLCLQIAMFYQNQTDRDLTMQLPRTYLVARYQVFAEDWSNAAATLQTCIDHPAQIFTAHCQRLYELVQEVYQHRHDIVLDDSVLLEIAGTCAAYLGLQRDAITYYEDLRDVLSPTDDAYPRLLARLTQVYKAVGDDAQVQQICYELMQRVPPDDPLYAIGQARAAGTLLSTEPEQAVELLESSITILNQTRDRWGSEFGFYEEQRILIYDTLAYAYAEIIPGQVGRAIDLLRTIRQDARRLSPILGARVDNDLGYIYYYIRGQSDPKRARKLFEDALHARQLFGDRAGQVLAAQNLANVLVDLATGASEWERAEDLLHETCKIALTLQTSDRYYLIGNYIHVLVLHGKLGAARDLFELVEGDHSKRDDQTQELLLLNHARLKLVERDAQACQHYLAEAFTFIETSALPINRVEWSIITLESHLQLAMPLDLQKVTDWIVGFEISKDERPIDAADWHYARGLLAIKNDDMEAALSELEACRALWAVANYHYRVAMIDYWKAMSYLRAGKHEQARRYVAEAEAGLRPFGEIPARAFLDDLSHS